MRKISIKTSGQTMVILLMFMVIGILVTTASVGLVLNNSRGTDKLYQGTNALDIAESGAETAMIKLLRETSYAGETLAVGDGQAVITVTGTNPKTILSRGTLNNFTRTIQVIVSTTNTVLTVTSWKEI